MFVFILGVFVIVGLVGHHAGEIVLGKFLERLFAKGTGCIVEFDHPRIHLFRSRGSLYNLRIYHPEERRNEGFHAEKVSVKIDLFALLRREVLLSNLLLTGVSAESNNPDGGFASTLEFLFEKKPPSENQGRARENRWRVKLSDFALSGRSSSEENLVLNFEGLRLKFLGLELQGERSELDPEEFQLSARAESFFMKKNDSSVLRAKNLHGRAEVRDSIIHLSALEGELQGSKSGDKFGDVQLAGEILLGASPDLRLQVVAGASPRFWKEYLPEDSTSLEPYDVSLHTSGSLTGSIVNPQYDGELRVTFPEIQGVFEENKRLDELIGRIFVNKAGLKISELQAPEMFIAETVSISFESPFQIESQLGATLLKSTKLSGSVSGALLPLRLEAELRAEVNSIVVEDHPPLNATLEMQALIDMEQIAVVLLESGEKRAEGFYVFPTGELELRNMSIPFGQGVVKGSATVGKDGLLSGSVDFQDVLMSSVPGLKGLFTQDTRIVGGGDLSGTLEKPELSGVFKLDTQVGPDPADVVRTDVQLSLDRFRAILTAELFEERGSIQLTYPFGSAENQELRLEATANDFPLDLFLPNEFITQGNFSALVAEKKSNGKKLPENTLTGEFHYVGPRNDPLKGTGAFLVSALRVRVGDELITSERPIVINVADGQLRFEEVQLFARGNSLTLSGLVDGVRGWQANLNGNWNVESINPFVSSLEQAAGDLEIALKLTGPASHPSLSGYVFLRQGIISLPVNQTILGATNVEADLKFQDSDVRIERLVGLVSDGELQGSGSVKDIWRSNHRLVELELFFKDVGLEPVDNFTAILGGTLKLHQSSGSPLTLSGDIGVRDASYENTISWSGIITEFTRGLIGRRSQEVSEARSVASGEGEELLFDLKFHAAEGVMVETNLIEAELSAELSVRGSPGAIVLTGNVRSIDGDFGLGANRFDLQRGVISFSDKRSPSDPLLDITGETMISTLNGDQHRIRMFVTGSLGRPRISFVSDSGLPEKEIAQLVGGATDLTPFAVTERRQRDYAFQELLNPASDVSLGDRLAGLTGFTEISIAETFSGVEGEFTPKVVAKRPIADELTLIVHAGLVEADDSAAVVTYDLTPYLSLFTGWSSRSLRDPQSSSGVLSSGLRYRKTYPGLGIIPPLFADPIELK